VRGNAALSTVNDFFEVLTIRDRKVCKIEYFRHGIEALEAAGLRE
jgi:hypothetical protein